jgi:hypothetical protein
VNESKSDRKNPRKQNEKPMEKIAKKKGADN